MKNLPTDELLRNFGAILGELRRRGICRTENLPTGDFAEHLACRALDLEQAPKSAKGFDAVASDGRRYQIKGRRITEWNPSTQLSAIRDLPEEPFDFLIAILFDQEFQITGAYQFTLAACQESARSVARTNSYIVFANAGLIGHPDTVDLTAAVRREYNKAEQGVAPQPAARSESDFSGSIPPST